MNIRKALPLFSLILICFSTVIQAETFERITGKVAYQSAGSSRTKKADQDIRLSPGDIVITEENSTAVLRTDDKQSLITLGENSRLLITETILDKQKTPSFLLFLGSLKAKIMKKEGQQFDFGTPAAVVGVRGTVFDIAVAEDGTSKIGVIDGSVGVNGQTASIVLSSSESSEVPLNGEPRDRIAYSEDEDLSVWQNTIRKNMKGNELEILEQVSEALHFNYSLINALMKEKSDAVSRVEEKKAESTALQEAGKEEEARTLAQEIMQDITDQTRMNIQAHHLDSRNQAIMEIAERIYRRNRRDQGIRNQFRIIEEEYNKIHSQFELNKKKGCLFF